MLVASAPLEAPAEVDGSERVLAWSRSAPGLLSFRVATARGSGFGNLLEARDLWVN